MTTEKEFICECGKHFTNGQAFNGHKSNCKIHYEQKYGSTCNLTDKYKKVAKSVSKFYVEARKKHDLDEQVAWQQAQHTCEKCGKLMLEKFGSGRFCSKACANSRERPRELRQQVSAKLKAFAINSNTVNQKHLVAYAANPKYCSVCGKELSYELRYRKTCSEECMLVRSKQAPGGLRQGSGTGKHGWYKGYYCDSSYELAYVIYNLDHNIFFERNKKAYYYIGTDDKVHKYYPDFIENGILIEIKGYWTENVQRKLDAVDDLPIKLLMKKDIQFMIDYVRKTYNCSDITILYEKF